MKLRNVLAPFAVLLAGCDLIIGPCTADFRAGILVTVTDSVTGAFIETGPVRIIATDGGYADTVFVSGSLLGGLAHERSGTYQVEVSAPGYDTWTRGGIRVRENSCHVETQSIFARLRSAGLS